MPGKQRDNIVLVLALLCIATAALAFLLPGDLPDAAVAAGAGASTAAVAPPPASTNVQERQSREAYTEMLSRPLFNPTRRPVAANTNGPQAGPAASQQSHGAQHELVGVVIIDNREFALIRDRATRKTERVTVGEEISGWKVTALTPNSATLIQRGETRTIALERKSSPRRTAKQATEIERLARQSATNTAVQATTARAGDEAVQNDEHDANAENANDEAAKDPPRNDEP